MATPTGAQSPPANPEQLRVGPFLQDAEPTSIWIAWETVGPAGSVVAFGLTPELGQTAEGSSIQSHAEARIHHTLLTGLEPDTPYYYRVSAPGQRVHRFRTPPARDAETDFRFAVYSDTQSGPNPRKHTEIINDGVIGFVTEQFGPEIADELAFTMIAGDLVDWGPNYHQWKEQFFDEEQNLAQHVPLYPVPGNHEGDAHWFFDYFKLPENGTPGFLEHWWYKDYANVRIIGIDSNGAYRIPEQLEWLDGVLASAANDPIIDFVFAQMHHPHKTPSWTPGNTAYIGEVIERLENFSTETGKPSVHFFGHTHAYERGQSLDHTHLWVDVSAGEGDLAWWGEYPREDYDEFQKVIMDWGFVLVEVDDGDNPSFRLRRVSRGNQYDPKDNEVVDDITIRMHNHPPASPSGVSPTNSAERVSPDALTLVGSAFSDTDGDEHLASQFQITTTPGDYTNPIVDEWIRFENWYAPEDATGRDNGWYSVDTRAGKLVNELEVRLLEPNTTYNWRVRYRDTALAWSEWSAERTFTTADAIVGACCLPEGGCEVLREYACVDRSGAWHGPAITSCTPTQGSPCPAIVVIFEEDFEDLTLGASVDEPGEQTGVWSDAPPAGWTVDRTGMPAGGITEWRGWAIANKDWWVRIAGDQGRSGFTRGIGAVAISDPDEFYDAETPGGGLFNSTLRSPAVSIASLAGASATLAFDSSWVPHAEMRATITASFDTGEPKPILVWTSVSGEQHKTQAISERVLVPFAVPTGAENVTFGFALDQAGNDWFWAIDNIRVFGETD